jgi:hypothetical protein
MNRGPELSSSGARPRIPSNGKKLEPPTPKLYF